MQLRRVEWLIASLGAVACGGGSTPLAPEDAPNVLLISIGALRADRLGAYGYEKPTSPALDALAASAVVFEEAEASAPWTLPALASILTAEVASTHGCRHLVSVLDDSFTTLPEHLLAAGYDTACVVSHLFATSRHGLQQGIVHTDDSYAYPEVDPAVNVTSQVISDKGIRFLDQKKASPDDAPWFLWLHYFDPHAELVPSGERGSVDVPGELYDAEVRYTDLHVGRVLERLRELGYAEDTVVVLVADHGEELLERGARGHSLHRDVVRVPLVIRAPLIAPRRVRDVVRQIDVLPTLLELVGLPLPSGSAGRSLVPFLRGATLPEAGALAELEDGALVLDSWRTSGFRLVRTGGPDGAVRLYDLAADPRETTDVAADHPEIVRAHLAELDQAKAAGRARASAFGRGRELALTPGLRDDLEALGYGGTHDLAGAEASSGR